MSESSVPPDEQSPEAPSEPLLGEPAGALDVLAKAVADLAGTDPHRSTPSELGDQLTRLEELLEVASGVAARWTDAFARAGGPEDAGSPTLAAWMRRELRLTPREARRRSKAATVFDLHPETRTEFFAGRINRQHVDAIADGVHQLGSKVFAQFEEVVLDVARECDADAVRQTIIKIRDTLDPDAADAAYVHALERRDVTIAKAGDGYVLGGFLPPETGVMFQQVMYAASKPTDAGDDRTAGQRRVDGLHELCRAVLDHGLPSDRGLRPHLFVTVSAERLDAVTSRGDVAGTLPASLSGYGEINDTLLSRLACDCAITPVVVDDEGEGVNRHVLDVGRTSRLATLKQRQAIQVRQGSTCANPGCDRTHLEIHHYIPWSLGGRTDLAELGGYCTRCHHLIHQGLVVVRPDGPGGWSHQTKRGRRLVDRQRRSYRSTTRFTQHLLIGGARYAREQHRRLRSGPSVQPESRPASPPIPAPRR
jgi:hypothetical protein